MVIQQLAPQSCAARRQFGFSTSAVPCGSRRVWTNGRIECLYVHVAHDCISPKAPACFCDRLLPPLKSNKVWQKDPVTVATGRQLVAVYGRCIAKCQMARAFGKK